MSSTKQTQAVAAANELFDYAAQVQSLFFKGQSIKQKYISQGLGAIFNALPTCAQNADGTLGDPDITPVAGNPIDTRIVVGLNRAHKASEIIGLKTLSSEFVDFMTGTLVATKVRTDDIDKVVGG